MDNNNDATIALLEKHFDIVFAAPNGIKKLRELILSLAMQGKLVPQNSSEPPASELLKEIDAEKERLIKEGKIKQSKPLPKIKPDEVLYDLPKSWEWVRFETISSYIQRGKSPKYVDKSEFPVIAQKCIQWHGLELEKAKFICPESVKTYSEERFLNTGDLLWNSTGLGTLGRVGIYIHEENTYQKVVADSHVTVIRPIFIESKLLYFWIASSFVQKDIEAKSSGSTKQIELATSTVKSHIFPLPPLPEQRRIVAKIDELMAQCDELEKLRSDRDRKQITVHTAALNRLLIVKHQSDFNTVWQFITQHFRELYSVKENVTELRKAILQLAVMGKLVPQDPSDQPASELLKEIDAEKERLIKEGKIKQSKPLPKIKPDEVPYDLPKSWEWVRFETISSYIQRGKSPKYVDKSEFPVIAQKCIQWHGLELEKAKFICPESVKTYSEERFLNTGDLLWNSTGLGTLGRVGIYIHEENTYQKVVADSHVTVIRPIFIESKLLYFWIASSFVQKDIEAKSSGSTKQIELATSTVKSHIFPLPPLAEQQRIVAQIDQLMALCDNLEKQIDNANSKQTNLLNAVMTKI
ncbi:MAG: hypothetical protein N5P05_004540 (plasmid) [Chroococcopsis gigantea SAG 12.99]|jgi:type I restriction enzyme S subunit|nr:hypothetical protein [Chroococcopsis gigantea SAG 12.99]